MAIVNNNTKNENTGVNQAKTYATDEAGMMKDAKSYAKQDFKTATELLKTLGITKLDNGVELTEEMTAKALISVKFKQIKEARLNRVSYFD